ncbi:MAG TPA: hypothetical protein VIR54_07080 [Vicinamibacterales bacterium]
MLDVLHRAVDRLQGAGVIANTIALREVIRIVEAMAEAMQRVLAHVEDESADRIENQCTLCYSYRKLLRDRLAAYRGEASTPVKGGDDFLFAALRLVIQRIEECGASPELTRASSVACDLLYAVGNQFNPPRSDARERVEAALRAAGAPSAQQPLDESANNAGVATGSRNDSPSESVTRGNLSPATPAKGGDAVQEAVELAIREGRDPFLAGINAKTQQPATPYAWGYTNTINGHKHIAMDRASRQVEGMAEHALYTLEDAHRLASTQAAGGGDDRDWEAEYDAAQGRAQELDDLCTANARWLFRAMNPGESDDHIEYEDSHDITAEAVGRLASTGSAPVAEVNGIGGVYDGCWLIPTPIALPHGTKLYAGSAPAPSGDASDAARYRAIRNPPPKGDAMCAWSTTEDGVLSARGEHDGPLTGEALDAAIDAAIAAAAPTQSQEAPAPSGEVAALRGFAQSVMEAWPMGDVDGGDLQSTAVTHGLLKPVTMAEPCSEEQCACAEYCTRDEFPVECFRKTTLLTGRPESDARIAELSAAPTQEPQTPKENK